VEFSHFLPKLPRLSELTRLGQNSNRVSTRSLRDIGLTFVSLPHSGKMSRRPPPTRRSGLHPALRRLARAGCAPASCPCWMRSGLPPILPCSGRRLWSSSFLPLWPCSGRPSVSGRSCPAGGVIPDGRRQGLFEGRR
jgi:hypothetical protein